MITQELQLKLLAYLDGELSASESAAIKELLPRDAEARELLGELQCTKSVLVGHEADCRMPESREFFWSKIEREIERQSSPVTVAPRVSWLQWLQGHLLPLSGAALLAVLLGIFTLHPGTSNAAAGEMELASDDVGSYTFRDQEHDATMVWLYDRTDDSIAGEPASAEKVVTQ